MTASATHTQRSFKDVRVFSKERCWLNSSSTIYYPIGRMGVCLSTPGGRGIPVPSYFPGQWSHILSGVDTLVPGSFPSHWPQVLSGGGYPSPGTILGNPLPGQDGHHPTPDRAAEQASRRAVCLLRSRRRTVLLNTRFSFHILIRFLSHALKLVDVNFGLVGSYN